MINYKLLQDSIEYYESKGYTRIETPWIVDGAANRITKPIDGSSLVVHPYEGLGYHDEEMGPKRGCLVASGEQSFLQLYLQEQLPKGQFQTITPCFRDDVLDYEHSKWFMKNELIKTDVVNMRELNIMVDKALAFFQKFIPNAYVMSDTHGYDIIGAGMELGSYGIRSCQFLDWIYGTGCAEPRFSKAISEHAKKPNS